MATSTDPYIRGTGDRPDGSKSGRLRDRMPRIGWLLPGLLLLVVLYYGIGMIVAHRVDDDLAFTPAAPPQGASHTVAMMAGLIDREAGHGHWRANDPFFLPGHFLIRTPEFQQGMVAAMARFAVELGDQVARTRGSSQADPDLDRASGLLKYPGNIWYVDSGSGFGTPSDRQYRNAVRALENYNQRLAQSQAVFEPRADNLIAVLERIAADLGSLSAVIDNEIGLDNPTYFNFAAMRILYGIKGRLYAYALLLRAMQQDFQGVIAEREVAPAYQQMLKSLEEGASIAPLFVLNGGPNALAAPNHLAFQGFYLLRARTQLREVSNILQK